MCNLYNLRVSRKSVLEYYNAVDATNRDLEKDYVAADRDGIACLRVHGTKTLQTMRWGFPPPVGVKGSVVNVRNYSSPFWRSTLTNPERRCLVPVTAFQEWSVERDPETGKKSKHWFSLPSKPIFSLAGIWRPTENGRAYAFLTCGYDGDPSTHIVGNIHPKACPVILHREDEDRWLTASLDDVIPSLACAFPSQLMAID